jgi:hypothetical protein
VAAAFLKLNRNASQQRSRKRQKFERSKEYKNLTAAEREARLNAIYEEINRARDIAKVEAIEEFKQEDDEMEEVESEEEHVIARKSEGGIDTEGEDDGSSIDEDESEDMEEDEDGTEDLEEYDEVRKNAISQVLEESIKEWKNHIKQLESRADEDEETNEPVNILSDVSDLEEEGE